MSEKFLRKNIFICWFHSLTRFFTWPSTTEKAWFRAKWFYIRIKLSCFFNSFSQLLKNTFLTHNLLTFQVTLTTQEKITMVIWTRVSAFFPWLKDQFPAQGGQNCQKKIKYFQRIHRLYDIFLLSDPHHIFLIWLCQCHVKGKFVLCTE